MSVNKIKIKLVFIFIISVYLTYLIIFNFSINHDKLLIITGPTSGSFYKLAVDYKKILEDKGFKVDLEPIANTSRLAQQVNDSKHANTVSFLIGPSDVSVLTNVRSLGIVGKQPLFIFHNKKNGPMENIASLKGKNILLPPNTSITGILSLQILDLYGVNEKNSTIHFVPLSETYTKITGDFYNACFLQLSTENPLVTQLAVHKNLNLYSYDNIHGILNKLKFLDYTQIPTGSFDILMKIPPQPVNLLSGNIEIIVNKNINKSIVYELLENFDSLHTQRTLVSIAGEFPKYVGTQFNMHEVVYDYKKSGTPWYIKNFSPFFANLFDNYIIYILIFVFFVTTYKNLFFYSQFYYMCVDYIALRIIAKNYIKNNSGKPIGYLNQILQRWAVDVTHRKTYREEAQEFIIKQKIF
jgi:TRAP-type uncharacterized transport system substrate-binding protein